jgi:hypothetical protein
MGRGKISWNINKKKYMKKLFIILSVVILLSGCENKERSQKISTVCVAGLSEESKKECFQITDVSYGAYSGGCIDAKKIDGEKIKICGTYTITD